MKTLLQINLPESSCDMLTKMLMGYVLYMPMNEKNYNEKLKVVIEFLEECLPSHAGAFATYFRILDKLPATLVRHVPEAFADFIELNIIEIEKYYEGTLPDKYKPKKILTKKNVLVDVTGQEIGTDLPPSKLVLV